jgi:hypothetical protein
MRPCILTLARGMSSEIELWALDSEECELASSVQKVAANASELRKN